MTIGVRSHSVDLPPDFTDFMHCLTARNVEFVLVGGYALGFHGVTRATADIDFLFRQTPSMVRRLCKALEDFGAPPSIIDADALLNPALVTQFGQPPHRIDLLGAIDGVNFDEVWEGAHAFTVAGVPIRVIGVKELVRNKLAAAREKDLADVRKLNALPPLR